MTLSLRFNASILVALLAVPVLAGWLGSRGLNEPDEGRFAEIAREMALQDDWLIPHLNGVPHFQKPPLTYWITAVFIRLCGANEWAVRLTPALAAFGTLLFTMYTAGVLYGTGCRWKTGLILLVSLGFFTVARLITTDMLLTFFITASIAGLVGYAHGGQKAWLCLFYGAMGLGFLTKGPLGILIPALAAAALQVGQRRQRKPVIRLHWWLGLPVALLIGLSWYLALIHRDRTLFDYFFHNELVSRVASNAHNRSKHIWFYPGTLALLLVPWTGFVVVMLRDLWRRRNLAATSVWLFIGWVVIPYAILSLVVSKLATYLIPFMPPLAIIIGRWLEHPATSDHWRRPACFTACVLGLLLLALPVLALISGGRFRPIGSLPAGFLIVIALAAASFLLLGRALDQGLSLKPFMFWMAATWACVMLALTVQADTSMTGGNSPVRRAMEYVRWADPDGTVPVLVYGTRANGTEFYLRRFVYRGFSMSDVVLPLTGEKLRQRIAHDEPLTADSLANRPAFILVKRSRFLRAPELRKWRVAVQDGSWMLLASRRVALDPSPYPVRVTYRTDAEHQEGRP